MAYSKKETLKAQTPNRPSAGKPASPESESREDPGYRIPTSWLWGGRQFGDTMAILAGLVFIFLCMILPLVGRAGVQTAWAATNRLVFTLTLLATLALSGLAVGTKTAQRRLTGSPRPLASIGLLLTSLLLLLALLTDTLGI
ncbi:MAG: hypothetical protein U1E27_04050 [Kiritimatiellia bacterium]|nr:hypothetical protein [Kiritimatiellia bacterium]